MCSHFVEVRGTRKKDEESPYYISHDYDQTHKPVREQEVAIGHSVRATYLYCAMADLALRLGDTSLFDACKRLFMSIAEKQMYVTGGIGSTRYGERFTEDCSFCKKNEPYRPRFNLCRYCRKGDL